MPFPACNACAGGCLPGHTSSKCEGNGGSAGATWLVLCCTASSLAQDRKAQSRFCLLSILMAAVDVLLSLPLLCAGPHEEPGAVAGAGSPRHACRLRCRPALQLGICPYSCSTPALLDTPAQPRLMPSHACSCCRLRVYKATNFQSTLCCAAARFFNTPLLHSCRSLTTGCSWTGPTETRLEPTSPS